MVVAEAATEGAGKAAAALVETAEVASAEMSATEMSATEMSATEMAPAAAVPSAPSRLRVRRGGEGQHRCKQRCEDDGTYANSAL